MTYAEKYMMRSRFFQLLGEAGKTMADAYSQADAENQSDIGALSVAAMTDSLIEHHGYRADEIAQPAAEIDSLPPVNPLAASHTAMLTALEGMVRKYVSADDGYPGDTPAHVARKAIELARLAVPATVQS